MPLANSKSRANSPKSERQSALFHFSASAFRVGLALATFEQVRPYGIMLSDICFFLSVFFLISCPGIHLLKVNRLRVLMGGPLILSGALLSLHSASNLYDSIDSLERLFILFGIFAPLAVIHSQSLRKNMLYLVGGIAANCIITMLQASAFPGIVDALSINPLRVPESAADMGRFQGLTGHPNILGLTSALGVLIAISLLLWEKRILIRRFLLLMIAVSTLGALLSGSRTFLASLIPGLLVLAFFGKMHRRLVVRAVFVLIVSWVGLSYLVPGVVSRYTDRFELTDEARLLTAGTAVAEIAEKPILGWGVDHFGEAGLIYLPEVGDLEPAHVTLLQYWYSAGLLGAVGFLALFVLPMWRMLRVLKGKPTGDPANMLRLGLAVYVLLFVASNLHPILFHRFLYIPLFIFAGLAARVPGPIKVRRTASQRVACLPEPNIQATS